MYLIIFLLFSVVGLFVIFSFNKTLHRRLNQLTEEAKKIDKIYHLDDEK